MKRLMIIDDDTDNRDLMTQMLAPSYEVISCASGKEGIERAIQERPEVILLDVHMPHMNGLEVCQRLKGHHLTRDIPVMMVSVESGIDYRVYSLEMGAEDYVTRPFHVRELMARINARIRRKTTDQVKNTALAIANLKLDPKSGQVFISEREVTLTQKQFEILRYFLEHPNQIISRAQLLGDLWANVSVSDRTIDSHLTNLKKQIRGFTCEFKSVHGIGYLLKVPQLEQPTSRAS
ncbi:MAG: response regulator transcription factor [Bdellovibrionota bacterium]